MQEIKPILVRKHSVEEEGSGKGIQMIYKFPNKYGASVVKFKVKSLTSGKFVIGNYGWEKGLFELAVIKFKDDLEVNIKKAIGKEDMDFELCYNTPITSNVIGWNERESSDDIKEDKEAKIKCNN